MTYSFTRIGAALKMKVEDLRQQGAGWRLRLGLLHNICLRPDAHYLGRCHRPCQPPQRVVMCGTLFLFARPYETHMTPIKQAEAFVAATVAQIDHGGTRAF